MLQRLLALCGLALALLVAWLLWPSASREAPRPSPGAKETVLPDAQRELVESTSTTAPVPERMALPASGFAPSDVYQGTVSSLTGSAVGGIDIEIRPVPDRDSLPIARGVTENNGTFSIPVPDGWDPEALVAAHLRGHGIRKTQQILRPHRPARILVRFVAQLAGRVLDAATQEPIADAEVVLDDAILETDAFGGFGPLQIRAGQGTIVQVRKAGFAANTIEVVGNRGASIDKTILLHRGALRRFRIVDLTHLDPIPGADVTLNRSSKGRTDAKGEVVLRVDPSSELNLRVVKKGYAQLQWSSPPVPGERLEEASFPLLALSWLEGHVRDDQGSPVAGCSVSASRDGAHSTSTVSQSLAPFGLESTCTFVLTHRQGWSAQTDAQGSFALPVLPAEAPLHVRFRAEGLCPGQAGPLLLTAGGERTRVDVVLHPGGTVRGKATYNGQPMQGCGISYRHADGRRGRTKTDADGHYALQNVPRGEVDVFLNDGIRWSALRPEPQRVLVVPGEDHQVDFLLREERLPIRGRVVDPFGNPVARRSIDVVSTSSGGHKARVESLSDGTFEALVPSGSGTRYDVGFDGPAGWEGVEGVPAGTTGIELVTPHEGRVLLRLLDASSDAVLVPSHREHQAISWRKSGTQAFRPIYRFRHVGEALELDVSHTNENGFVDLRVRLGEQGYQPATLTGIPMTSGDLEPPIVDLRLHAGLSCRLQLTRPMTADQRRDHLIFLLHAEQEAMVRGPFPSQGAPANIRIDRMNMWLEAPGLIRQLASFHDNGFVTLKGLRPGRYSLQCYPDTYAFDPATFEIREDGSTIELQWSTR